MSVTKEKFQSWLSPTTLSYLMKLRGRHNAKCISYMDIRRPWNDHHRGEQPDDPGGREEGHLVRQRTENKYRRCNNTNHWLRRGLQVIGAKIVPWRGIHCGIIVPEILSVARRARKVSLKPWKKIDLLMNYIFPRYIYHLLVNPPNNSVLKLMDSEVRQVINAMHSSTLQKLMGV